MLAFFVGMLETMKGIHAGGAPRGHDGAGAHILLTIQAVRIAWLAQRAVHDPLPVAITALNKLRGLPRQVAIPAALRATRRAARVLSMLGRRSQCLHDALVLSTLLSDRADVFIWLGFRDKSAAGIEDVDGHAWITVGDQPILHIPDELGEYVASSRYPARRPSP